MGDEDRLRARLAALELKVDRMAEILDSAEAEANIGSHLAAFLLPLLMQPALRDADAVADGLRFLATQIEEASRPWPDRGAVAAIVTRRLHALAQDVDPSTPS